MGIINKLNIKSIKTNNLEQLCFIITNDIYQLVKFDRAILFLIENKKYRIKNVSGQTSVKKEGERLTEILNIASSIQDPQNSRFISQDDIPQAINQWDTYQSENPSKVYWLSMPVKENVLAALWMESWDTSQQSFKELTYSEGLIKEFLLPGLSTAFQNKYKSYSFGRFSSLINKKRLALFSTLLLASLFLIPVQLRIVAPCEVVALDPYVINAPLDGIIERILVKPGEEVKKSAPLVKYDPRIPSQEYKIAEKEREIIQSEIDSIYAGGINDIKEVSQLAPLNAKLRKTQSQMNFLKNQISLLTIKAPFTGIVEVTFPDDWRGKQVKIGEKIMTLSDPGKTKVKIWIPERDYVDFSSEKLIKIILNSIPDKTFRANLGFIAPIVKVEEGQVPSFLAEAYWNNPEEAPKLGLKGSAVLYGERVSLFYYIFRKPLLSLRIFFGL